MAVVVAAVGAGVAGAAHYSKPELLDDGRADHYNPQAAADPSGRTTVVWEREDSRGSASSFVESVRLGQDGKPMGPVRRLSEDGARGAKLAVDPAGGSTVIWNRLGRNDRPFVEAIRLDPNGEPAGPVRVISPEGRKGAEPEVAVDATGASTVVWAGDGIVAARLAPDGSPEAEPVTVAASRRVRSPDVAVDAQGSATVAWRQGDSAVFAARLGSDGAVDVPEQKLSPAKSRFVKPPLVASDDRGRAVVAWEASTKRFSGIRASFLDKDGKPSPAKPVSGRVRDPRFSQLALTPSGRGVVVWQGWNPPQGLNGFPQGRAIYAAATTADGNVGRVRKLSGRLSAFSEPRVAIDSDARATVVWPWFDGTSTRIQAVGLRPNAAPRKVEVISPPGRKNHANARTPDVGVDPDGRATVVWIRLVGNFFRVEAARSR